MRIIAPAATEPAKTSRRENALPDKELQVFLPPLATVDSRSNAVIAVNSQPWTDRRIGRLDNGTAHDRRERLPGAERWPSMNQAWIDAKDFDLIQVSLQAFSRRPGGRP